MKLVKQTAEYSIYQKRNNRYGVKGANKKWINADDKVKVLLAEGLIKVSEPAAPAEEPTEESAEETTAEESAEASTEADEQEEKTEE